MKRWFAILAAAVFAAATAPTASAFPKETAKKPAAMKKMPPGKMMAKGTWVDKTCKMCFSPAQAMKAHYKCPMGHKLVKMAKCPAGYKMMGRMSMNGKMPMDGKMPMKGKMAPMMKK